MSNRMRAGFGTESSTSISSAGSLNSPKDFHEVKELVKEISRRLDVLEKVFVFVDLEQINHALANFSATTMLGKAGTDVTFSSKLDIATPEEKPTPREACVETPKANITASDGIRDLNPVYGEWQALPDGRVSAGSIRPLKSSLKHDMGFESRGRLQPLEVPKSKHSTTNFLQAPKLFHPTGSFLQDVAESHNGVTACTVDLQDDFTRITDDREKSRRSTGSTTAFASTCDAEDDIEPERCNNFVKQALQSSKAKQAWIGRVNRMREKTTVDPAWNLDDHS